MSKTIKNVEIIDVSELNTLTDALEAAEKCFELAGIECKEPTALEIIKYFEDELYEFQTLELEAYLPTNDQFIRGGEQEEDKDLMFKDDLIALVEDMEPTFLNFKAIKAAVECVSFRVPLTIPREQNGYKCRCGKVHSFYQPGTYKYCEDCGQLLHFTGFIKT